MEKTLGNTTGVNSAYDKKRFAELCRLALGSRSIVAFAKECGLSQSFLSRALNQQLPSRPSRRSLIKLTDKNTAHPANNVTLKDVMSAVGYIPLEPLPESEPIVENAPLPSESITFCQSVLDYFNLSSPTQAMGILVDALIKKGIDKNLTIQMHPGFFEVTDTKNQLKYVGISAFFEDETAIKIMKFTLKSIFSDQNSLKWDWADHVTYYIMTDNDTLFDYCSKISYPGFCGKRLAILYTKDHRSITQEFWIVPKEKPSNILPESLVEDSRLDMTTKTEPKKQEERSTCFIHEEE